MERQTVIERKIRLDGTAEDFVCEALALDPGRRAVLRYVLDREWDVAGILRVPRGAVTVAHYWTDRPYNVYHWLDGDRTIALYVNAAAETAVAEGLVSYLDLAVDVLLHPAGRIEVLDEDELPADLAPALRRTVAEALEAVVTDGRRLAAEIEKESRAALGR